MSFPWNITNPGFVIVGQLTSAEAAFVTNLAGLSYTTGDILYYDGADLTNLAVGSEGEALVVASGVPAWSLLFTVSATAPSSPSVNDLWFDIS